MATAGAAVQHNTLNISATHCNIILRSVTSIRNILGRESVVRGGIILKRDLKKCIRKFLGPELADPHWGSVEAGCM
jgi:hypothetical protein